MRYFFLTLFLFIQTALAAPDPVLHSVILNTSGTTVLTGSGGSLLVGGLPVSGGFTVLATSTTSASGTATVNSTGFWQKRQYIAGGGAYTEDIVLPTTGKASGQTADFLLSIDANSQASVNVLSGSEGGSNLFTYTSGTLNGLCRAQFIYDGNAWVPASPNTVFESAHQAVAVAWWKADSLSLSNSATVTTWTDSSGNGNDLTGVNAPKYIASAFIGIDAPAIQFTGSSGSHFTVPGIQLNDYTAFVVIKPNVGNKPVMLADINSTNQVFSTRGDDGRLDAYDQVHIPAATPTTPLSDGWSLVIIKVSGGVVSFYQNADSLTNTGDATLNTPIIFTSVGYVQFGAQVMDGLIAEIKVFDGAVSDAQLAVEQAYFNGKYNLW